MYSSKPLYGALGVAILLLPVAAAAGQPTQKPGLWEVTSNIKMGGETPQIPPDQLARMQQMGIQIPQMGGK